MRAKKTLSKEKQKTTTAPKTMSKMDRMNRMKTMTKAESKLTMAKLDKMKKMATMKAMKPSSPLGGTRSLGKKGSGGLLKDALAMGEAAKLDKLSLIDLRNALI